jgi:hypothetical protein
MVYLEDMKRFVCVLSNGQVLILDDKQNKKESASTKLPDELRPHGISVQDRKTVLIGCDKGCLVRLSLTQQDPDPKPEIKMAQLFLPSITLYQIIKTSNPKNRNEYLICSSKGVHFRTLSNESRFEFEGAKSSILEEQGTFTTVVELTQTTMAVSAMDQHQVIIIETANGTSKAIKAIRFEYPVISLVGSSVFIE